MTHYLHICRCGWKGYRPPPAHEHVGHQITAIPLDDLSLDELPQDLPIPPDETEPLEKPRRIDEDYADLDLLDDVRPW